MNQSHGSNISYCYYKSQRQLSWSRFGGNSCETRASNQTDSWLRFFSNLGTQWKLKDVGVQQNYPNPVTKPSSFHTKTIETYTGANAMLCTNLWTDLASSEPWRKKKIENKEKHVDVEFTRRVSSPHFHHYRSLVVVPCGPLYQFERPPQDYPYTRKLRSTIFTDTLDRDEQTIRK